LGCKDKREIRLRISDSPSLICMAEPNTYTTIYENNTFRIMYEVILSLLFNRPLLIILLTNVSWTFMSLIKTFTFTPVYSLAYLKKEISPFHFYAIHKISHLYSLNSLTWTCIFFQHINETRVIRHISKARGKYLWLFYNTLNVQHGNKQCGKPQCV
jgi:hypothetical protein